MKFRLLLLLLAALMPAQTLMAADTAEVKTISIPKSYLPTFHGTFRTFYEQSTATGDRRFSVRNARLIVGGKVLPVADYYFQVDLCDRGKIKILDCYISVSPTKGLKVIAGQSRVPFSMGASRAPALYHFANRAAVCKWFGNLRAAGVKIGYKVPSTALYIEGGAFNGTDMTDHSGWNSSLTYSVKANYTFGGLTPQVCFMSRKPGLDGVRMNQADASVTFQNDSWFIEAEYCYRHYAHDMHDASHGYNFEIDYGFPVNWRLMNRWSFQGRFDGITDASNGVPTENGILTDNYAGHSRLTLGTTASYIAGPLHCDFRLNYEQYFYSGNHRAKSAADDNKLVAALVLYF